jgi:hypothetical protein
MNKVDQKCTLLVSTVLQTEVKSVSKIFESQLAMSFLFLQKATRNARQHERKTKYGCDEEMKYLIH